MENYKPNSHKSKEDSSGERRVEKVINGTARVKKKSTTRKFTDVFISEDASNVKTYILSDVLVPAVKKLITDIVKDGIDMILYGGTRPRNGHSRRLGSEYISYDKYSDPRDSYRNSTKAKSRFSYDDIEFESRGEAEAVRAQMAEVIRKFGFVTVSDLYDMADLTAPYTGNKYGWDNIDDVRNAEPIRLRDGGYILNLPKVHLID